MGGDSGFREDIPFYSCRMEALHPAVLPSSWSACAPVHQHQKLATQRGHRREGTRTGVGTGTTPSPGPVGPREGKQNFRENDKGKCHSTVASRKAQRQLDKEGTIRRARVGQGEARANKF